LRGREVRVEATVRPYIFREGATSKRGVALDISMIEPHRQLKPYFAGGFQILDPAFARGPPLSVEQILSTMNFPPAQKSGIMMLAEARVEPAEFSNVQASADPAVGLAAFLL